MVQESVAWFGALTPNVAITVTGGTSQPGGLLGHWKLDDNASDSSGNGNHGTRVNGSTWMAGKSGSAASFDGVNDYLTIASSTSINAPRTGLTIAMWVYKRTTDIPTLSIMAGRRFGTGWDDTWVLFYGSGASDPYSFGVRTGAPVFVAGPSSAADLNRWVHVAGVYDGTRIRIYRNGLQVASALQSGQIPVEASPLLLGAGDNGTNGIGEFLNAGMDDVRLYSRALSVSEIQALAGAAPVYLSDLTWTYAVSGWGPVERDRSNGEQPAGDGRSMMINGVSYAKGLGVHSYSEIRYALGGQYASFLADVGVDDEVDIAANTYSSVVFQVWADGVKLFDSGVMTKTMAARPVNVSVAGRQELILVVTNAGDRNNYDHADWANAMVIR